MTSWWFFCLATICSRLHLYLWCCESVMSQCLVANSSAHACRHRHVDQDQREVRCAFVSRRAIDFASPGANITVCLFWITLQSPCSIADMFCLPAAATSIWHVSWPRDDQCLPVFYHWSTPSYSNYWQQDSAWQIACFNTSMELSWSRVVLVMPCVSHQLLAVATCFINHI
jgi:hypothetical protein